MFASKSKIQCQLDFKYLSSKGFIFALVKTINIQLGLAVVFKHLENVALPPIGDIVQETD